MLASYDRAGNDSPASRTWELLTAGAGAGCPPRCWAARDAEPARSRTAARGRGGRRRALNDRRRRRARSRTALRRDHHRRQGACDDARRGAPRARRARGRVGPRAGDHTGGWRPRAAAARRPAARAGVADAIASRRSPDVEPSTRGWRRRRECRPGPGRQHRRRPRRSTSAYPCRGPSRLESTGFTILAEVADADTAVAEAERDKPELVLLDLYLPGDGLAAARLIHERVPATTIVILTTSPSDEDRFAALVAEARLPPEGHVGETAADRAPWILAGDAGLPRTLEKRLVEESGRSMRQLHALPPASTHGTRADLTSREGRCWSSSPRGCRPRRSPSGRGSEVSVAAIFFRRAKARRHRPAQRPVERSSKGSASDRREAHEPNDPTRREAVCWIDPLPRALVCAPS